MYKIVLFPKIQIDTLISYFILKNFGDFKFPGIKDAEVIFMSELPENTTADEMEQNGYILIDLGNGRFDHHRLGPNNKKFSAAHLVAEFLEVDDLPELQKMLQIARRDDLFGKGTISLDPLDRTFGLPGLLMSLVKTYSKHPKYVLDVLSPLIEAHYHQEYQKYQSLPKEYAQALELGHAKEFNAAQLGKQLKVVFIRSDNMALAGYIRSRAVNGDLVIQRSSTNHVNFVSNQKSQLKIHELARKIKLLEAEKNNISLQIDSLDELLLPGKTEGLPHWYYDTRANTLQNGGMSPGSVPPTLLTDEDIESATKRALNVSRESLVSFTPQQRYYSKSTSKRNTNYKTKRTRGAIIID